MIDSTPPDSRPAADGAGAPTLPRGTRLPDGLEIERVLAADGFAVVYLANDPALQRQVAVKEYFPRALAVRDAEGAVVLRAPVHAEAFEHGRAAFMDESRQLARVDHPSLVRVLRLREDRGTAWRVMPYYPGRTLA
ncbi:MAG TPA: serine/threonine protein kinase, partial [Burkholderiaceae bacterium]